MNKTDSYIDSDTEKEFLFTYSEEEKQNNEINKSNASLIFSPEFIPYRIDIKRKFNLTHIETLLYGFIRFYKSAGNSRFYFTNEQLSEILDTSMSTINNSVRTLKDKELIDIGHRIKANGGIVRFINHINKSECEKINIRNVNQLTGNKNNINNNNINIYISTFISSFNERTGKKFRVTDKLSKLLSLRLKNFTFEEISNALENMLSVPFYLGKNDRKWCADPMFLLRNDEQIDKFLNLKENKDPNKTIDGIEILKGLNQ